MPVANLGIAVSERYEIVATDAEMVIFGGNVELSDEYCSSGRLKLRYFRLICFLRKTLSGILGRACRLYGTSLPRWNYGTAAAIPPSNGAAVAPSLFCSRPSLRVFVFERGSARSAQ